MPDSGLVLSNTSYINLHFSRPDRSQLSKYPSQPTEEAVDDAKQATHGADDRRDHLIAPFNVLITAEQALWTSILGGWGELKGQNLGSGRHAVSVY